MISKKRIPALDGMRGLAALCIALFHFQTTSPITNNQFIHHGYLMVDFFFVLSGFVMALHYNGKLTNAMDIIRFQGRRLARLYPLHILTLLAFLGIECAKYIVEHHTNIIANSPAFTKNDTAAFLQNAFLTHGLGFMDQLTFNYPSWAVSTLFFTYLIFSLIQWLTPTRMINIVYGIIIVICAALLIHMGHGLHYAPDTSLIRCLYSFFIGLMGYHLYNVVPTTKRLGVLTPLLILVCTSIVIWGDHAGAFIYALPCLFGLMAITLSHAQHGITARILSWRPLTTLGTISFSIYMWHALLWWIMNQTLRFGFGTALQTDEFGTLTPNLSPHMATISTIIGISILIMMSMLSHRLIEQRLSRAVSSITLEWFARRAMSIYINRNKGHPKIMRNISHALTHNNETFHALLDDVDNANAQFRADGDSWSIIDIMEHLTLIETAIVKTLQDDGPVEGKEEVLIDDAVYTATKNRGFKVPAPEWSIPKGEYKTLEDVMAVFDKNRQMVFNMIENGFVKPTGRVLTHPIFGDMTANDTVRFMIAHANRHIGQIEELKKVSI